MSFNRYSHQLFQLDFCSHCTKTCLWLSCNEQDVLKSMSKEDNLTIEETVNLFGGLRMNILLYFIPCESHSAVFFNKEYVGNF